jgi:lysophospholipase L1-like esterase
VRALLAGLTVTLLVVAGCTAAPEPESGPTPVPHAPAPQVRSYVALGDSYAAAPLVPTTDLAGGCFRSDHNYPALLAARLEVTRFTDVTCSGATTADLSGRQVTVRDATVPPQLRAVRPDTDLVTLGIGGNDDGLFGFLVRRCSRLRGLDPDGAPCAKALAARLPSVAQTGRRITTQVVAAVRTVQRRAPAATVVLVGYPRLAPEHGTCPRLPLAAGDYATARTITRALNRALRRAAAATGARFVDLYAASRGHDICSADPWVNGRRTVEGRALAYHPLAAGMRAAADAVLVELRRGASGSR